MAILKDTAMVHTSSTFHISLCILQYILLYILFLPFYIYLIVIKQQQQRIMKAQMLPQMMMCLGDDAGNWIRCLIIV